MNPSSIGVLVLVPLLAWRIYARFRRLVGRQRLSRIRPWVTLILFPALVCLMAYAARAHPDLLGLLGLGLAVGALLAVYGLRLTQFEPTGEGLFYTPNALLGIALSLLFVGRILYRAVEIYGTRTASLPDAAGFVQSPLTMGTFGLLAGYYIAYMVGLARWRGRVMRAKRLREQRER